MIRHANLPPLSLDGWREPVVLVGARGRGPMLWARHALERVPPDEWCWWTGDSDHLFRQAGMIRELDARRGERLDRAPPFRAPHHSVSVLGLTGRVEHGWRLWPGELSLATGGVLFLDGGHEFGHEALSTVLRAVKSGQIELDGWGSRGAFVTHAVPAEFKLVIGMEPCPCGYHGHSARAERCRCDVGGVHRCQSRIGWLVSEGCRLLGESEYTLEVEAYVRELDRRTKSREVAG